MISGLKVRVTCEELKTHCVERAKYHDERAVQKEAELPQLKEIIESIKAGKVAENVARMSGKSGYNFNAEDPVRDLETDIRDHRNKALVFRWFSEHFFPEDYTLEESDLVRLEILKRW
jgi:hypothetical protein